MDTNKVLVNSCQREAIVTNQYLTQVSFQTKHWTSAKDSFINSEGLQTFGRKLLISI